jgi:hypothetical protein
MLPEALFLIAKLWEEPKCPAKGNVYKCESSIRLMY